MSAVQSVALPAVSVVGASSRVASLREAQDIDLHAVSYDFQFRINRGASRTP